MRARRRSLLINGGLVVVLGAVGVGSYVAFAGGGSSKGSNLATATVTRGTVRATVSASGTVVSPKTVAVDFTTGGTVTELNVKVGDHVTKGEVLARVDSSSDEADLQSAYAGVSTAEAGLVSAQASLESAKANLAEVKKNDPTDSQLAQAEAQVTSARAQVDQAEASVTSARAQVTKAQETIDGTVLKAPMTGTIVALNGGVGDTAPSGGVSLVSSSSADSSSSSNSSASGSSSFLEIGDLDHLKVRAYFSETDTAKLKVGQHVTVTLNALPGKQATGKVVSIDPTSTTVNQVVDYGVTVRLTKKPKSIRVGQTAVVVVVTGVARNVLSVPSAAVTTAGGRNTVTLLQNGRQVTRVVQVGLEGDQTTEIRSGLSMGDQVVISSSSSGGGFPSGGFPGGGVVTRIGG
jgi:macrolide-specific efflux system membrane fusion protein